MLGVLLTDVAMVAVRKRGEVAEVKLGLPPLSLLRPLLVSATAGQVK